MPFLKATIIYAAILSLAWPNAVIAQNSQTKKVQAISAMAPQRVGKRVKHSALNVSLLKAIVSHDVARVKALLDKGADANARDKKGFPALILALEDVMPDNAEAAGGKSHNKATAKKQVEIAEALLAQGANPNVETKDGETPLIAGAASGSISLIKNLIRRGAKVDHANKEGMTALMLASFARDGQIISLLLDQGAKVNAKDTSGSTALVYALLPSNLSGLKVSKSPNTESAFKILIDHGANVNIDATVYTPLMGAAMSGNIKAALILLEKGAKVDGMGLSDLAPLPSAIEADQFEMAMMLLDHGANPNQTNRGGIPVLMLAVDHNSPPLIEKLIKLGAKTDVVIHGIEGITPLEVARAKKLTAVLELFARLGVTK